METTVAITDDRTQNLSLPLPHLNNPISTDVGRLRTALTDLDASIGAIQAGNISTDLIREIAIGNAVGWNWSYTGSDPAAPATEVWANGLSRLRATHAYTSGLLTSTAYAVSENGGGTWSAFGTVAYAYDGNGFISSTTWS